MIIGERLSDRLLNLLEHFRLGFEELVIISLRHDQCRFIRLLNDTDTVIRRKGRDELDRFFDVRGLTSEGAETSEEAGRIDTLRSQHPNHLDRGRLHERSDEIDRR